MNSDLPIGIDALGGDQAEGMAPYKRIARAAYLVAKNEPAQRFIIAGPQLLLQRTIARLPDNLEIIQGDDQKFGATRILAKMLADGKISGFYSLENTQRLAPAAHKYVGNFEACEYAFPVKCETYENKQRSLPLLAELPKSCDAKRTGSWYLLDVGGMMTGASLRQFITYAHIGRMYATVVGGLKNVNLGLLNIGREDNKGESLDIQVNAELSRLFPKTSDDSLSGRCCFTGNVEAHPCILDKEKGSEEYRPVDVALADARTGNLIIKWWAAGAEFYAREFRYEASRGKPWEKAGAAMSREVHKRIKSRISRYGVSKFPCLNKPVCKGHGTSGLESITAGILHLMHYIKTDGTGKMRAAVENYAKELARERW
jgi:glycerol-3-phosphate acyltransferase PlsX